MYCHSPKYWSLWFLEHTEAVWLFSTVRRFLFSVISTLSFSRLLFVLLLMFSRNRVDRPGFDSRFLCRSVYRSNHIDRYDQHTNLCNDVCLISVSLNPPYSEQTIIISSSKSTAVVLEEITTRYIRWSVAVSNSQSMYMWFNFLQYRFHTMTSVGQFYQSSSLIPVLRAIMLLRVQ